MEELLKKLNAGEEMINWAKGKSWDEFYHQCNRGEWLFWLFTKTNPYDAKKYSIAANAAMSAYFTDKSKEEQLKQVAKICRQFLPIEIWKF